MSFKDIRGQSQALELLQRAIKGGNVSKAYLFTGADGIGKRMAALEFAAALNCRDSQAAPCGDCRLCLKIKANNHPDVRLIGDEDGVIKIEAVRQMQREINLRPYEAKFKVQIIDNAHNLNAESSNALLKTLEEPPAHSVIILVSSKPALLFKTVISRCQVVRFYPMARRELEEVLRQEHGLDVLRAHFLGYFCEGRLGHALRLKDSGFYQAKNLVIDEFSAGRRQIAANQPPYLTRQGLKENINVMVSWFRDISLLKAGMPAEDAIHLDRSRELEKAAAGYSFAELVRIIDLLSETVLRVEQNVNIKLLISDLKAELWKR